MDNSAFVILRGYLGFTSPLGENMDEPIFSAEYLLDKVSGLEKILNDNPAHFMSPSEDTRALRRLKEIARLVRNGATDRDHRFQLANALSWCMQGYGNAADCAEEYKEGSISDAVRMMG